MNQGYPPQQGFGPGPGPQGYNHFAGQPFPPPGGPAGYPPPNQGPYGPPGGQYGGYQGGPPPAGAPTPPSPGYSSLHQSNVDVTHTAQQLRSAMKGFGTNETVLIDVLSRLGPVEIRNVKDSFASQFRRDLIKDVHSETSGNFRATLEAILRGPLDQDCYVLYNAMEGLGTKESALNDVLLLRSNADMHAIKAHYHQKYHRTLEQDIKGDLSLKTERMFEMVLAARRAEESAPIIPQQVEADVRELYAATEGRTGTDQLTVCTILTSRSNGQLRAIAQRYREIYYRELDEVLRSEFSGHMEEALRFIIRGAVDPAKHDADMLEQAMRGLGTNDSALIRRAVAIHWNRARMQQCRAAYKHFYHKELSQRIHGETSGDYRKIVTACILQT